jgi:hypothetical protein
MAKGKLTKDRQYLSVFCQFNFGHDIVYLLSLHLSPSYCLSFVSFSLAMILSVFCHFIFGHDIVFFLLAKDKLTKERQYHGQRETNKRQTISWPKGN